MLAMHQTSTSLTTNAARSYKMHLRNTSMTTSSSRHMLTAEMPQSAPYRLGRTTLEQALPRVIPTSQYRSGTAYANKQISPLISCDHLVDTQSCQHTPAFMATLTLTEHRLHHPAPKLWPTKHHNNEQPIHRMDNTASTSDRRCTTTVATKSISQLPMESVT